jgi:zinc transport system substrate-binding protein
MISYDDYLLDNDKEGFMRPKKLFMLFFVVFCAYMIIFYSPSDAAAEKKLTIYTVNYPLKYFAERIAGEHANVVFPAPADGDPAYWVPDAKTITDYQKADLILLNGAQYARWTEKVTLPRSKMVDTSRKFKDRYVKLEEAVSHSHGPEGEHEHMGIAFTTWLDLDLAAKQAGEIENALSRKRPDLKSVFQRNYAALEKDLLALDRDIKAIVANKQKKPLVGSHPVYQYLERRYGLNMKSVHWEPDEAPDSKQLTELKGILKKHPAKWMIWEGDPLDETVSTLTGMGMKSIVFDPCGNKPETGDFMSVMQQNVKNLKTVFK